MIALLLAVAVLLVGAVAVLLLSRGGRDYSWLGAGSVVVAAVLGCVPAIRVLLSNVSGPILSLRSTPSPIPWGEIFIAVDPLTAWFLLPTLLLSALAAIYGVGYLRPWRGKRSLGPVWFFYCLLVLGMMLVLLARNAVLFLYAWELMAIASFFLVTFEHERQAVREAGWIYLVATHLGTAFLLAFFLLLGRETGSMDFDVWAQQGIHTQGLANVLFLLAVVGFGTKAGFMPLHVWLPEAHPAAPSHVSALMSGVMIKTGIYGLMRAFTFLGTPPLWWGWGLVAIGLSSGVLGVLYALAQHDLKRLLAYHSVENIGIIALGLGVGLLGMSTGSAVLTVLGFGGALLHVLNHALFKGLLFLGAGSVAHSTGTREIDHLGGLLKRMPWTAAAFLIGAVAISGLPPLNGFVSEFLIFFGAFKGAISTSGPVAVPLLALITGLALIGGLAVACFTKAFGIVFLGEPRSEHVSRAHEVDWTMRLPMLILSAGCVGIGLFAPVVIGGLQKVLENMTAQRPEVVSLTLASATVSLMFVVIGAVIFLLLVAVLVLVRRGLLAGRRVDEDVTWGCGYAQPTARMQYTASSFAQPLTDLFRSLLGTKKKISAPGGLFPADAALKTETPDLSREEMYRPMFERGEAWLSQLRWLQHGNVQLYILYIAATLMVLLVWKFR
ncbi:MAG TPA: proton-conducting transporter membrane subunit [Verrucomicrobiae bacterium]|nr:proton-conducting transporter membrane subunit [Verrucomicrobiae bacterium]